MCAEFRAFPKIPRLFRDCIVTEKIDGTNGCIVIEDGGKRYDEPDGAQWLVTAQSRNRIITPEADNHGFAKWVQENQETLIADLGPGYHYGEWWGSGIQRGYGLPKGEKRFSLFNVTRWGAAEFATPNLSVVPVLSHGLFDMDDVAGALDLLVQDGSYAAPGFMRPEGIVIYHTAANQMFKATIEGDDQPKSLGR